MAKKHKQDQPKSDRTVASMAREFLAMRKQGSECFKKSGDMYPELVKELLLRNGRMKLSATEELVLSDPFAEKMRTFKNCYVDRYEIKIASIIDAAGAVAGTSKQ